MKLTGEQLSGDVVKRMNAAYANAYGTTMLTFGERHKAALTAAARVCIAAKDAEIARLREALKDARDFIASVECEEGLTTDGLIERVDAALEAKHD